MLLLVQKYEKRFKIHDSHIKYVTLHSNDPTAEASFSLIPQSTKALRAF